MTRDQKTTKLTNDYLIYQDKKYKINVYRIVKLKHSRLNGDKT